MPPPRPSGCGANTRDSLPSQDSMKCEDGTPCHCCPPGQRGGVSTGAACAHCMQPMCESCTALCDRCNHIFCAHCSTINFCNCKLVTPSSNMNFARVNLLPIAQALARNPQSGAFGQDFQPGILRQEFSARNPPPGVLSQELSARSPQTSPQDRDLGQKSSARNPQTAQGCPPRLRVCSRLFFC